MNRIVAFIAIIMVSTLTIHAQEKQRYYDEEANGMEQIEMAIAKAQESQRYVLCQVGGDWCPWCIRFANLAKSDSTLSSIIEKNFVYIHINYSKNNKNPEAMEFLGNPARFGFPVFVIINDEGTPIHIQESDVLESGKSYDTKKVSKFLLNWTKEAVTTLK